MSGKLEIRLQNVKLDVFFCFVNLPDRTLACHLNGISRYLSIHFIPSIHWLHFTASVSQSQSWAVKVEKTKNASIK